MARLVFSIAVPPEVTVEVAPLCFARGEFVGEHGTTCGWPYRLVEHPDGRITACYRFLDHEAAATARGPRDRVLALLASARPDWHGDDVIALAQLWDPR